MSKDPLTAQTVGGVIELEFDVKSVADKLPPTNDLRCGIRAGYKAHQKRGEFACQSCRNAMALLSAKERALNPEKKRAEGVAYRIKYPEEIAQRSRKYREANRDTISAKYALYREENKEKEKARHSKYHKANPGIGKKSYARWKFAHPGDKTPPTFSKKCGTFAGYSRHGKRNEIPCLPCKKARSDYHRKLLIDTPAKKELARTRARLYYQANTEKVKKYSVEYTKKNPDKTKVWRRNSYIKNPEKALRDTHKRRAMKLGNGHTPYTFSQILDLYGADCHLCHEPIDLNAPRRVGREGWERGLHIDHKVPLAKGGSDDIGNARPTHGLCNLTKGGR